MFGRLFRNKKGQGLVEYALIIAGVALICAVAISLFGHKVTDLIAAVAAVLPGAHAADNAPIVAGSLIEATDAADGPIGLDLEAIRAADNTPRLSTNVLGPTEGGEAFGGMVIDPGGEQP